MYIYINNLNNGTTSFSRSSFVRPSIPRINIYSDHRVDIYIFPDHYNIPNHSIDVYMYPDLQLPWLVSSLSETHGDLQLIPEVDQLPH